jgi:hypothetical protein
MKVQFSLLVSRDEVSAMIIRGKFHCSGTGIEGFTTTRVGFDILLRSFAFVFCLLYLLRLGSCAYHQVS